MSGDLFSSIPPSVIGILLLIIIGLVLEFLNKSLEKFWKAFAHSIFVLFGGNPKKAPDRMAGEGGGSTKGLFVFFLVSAVFIILIFFLPFLTLYKIMFVVIIVAVAFSFIMKRVVKLNSIKPDTNVLVNNYQSSALTSTAKLSITKAVPNSEQRIVGTRKSIKWIEFSNTKMKTEAFEVPDNSNARWYIDRHWQTYWSPHETQWKEEWFDSARCSVEIRDEETDKLIKILSMGVKKPVDGFEVDEEYNCSEQLTIWGRLYLVIEVTGYQGHWKVGVCFFEPSANPPNPTEKEEFDKVEKSGLFRSFDSK